MLETKSDGDRSEMLALTIFIISQGRHYLKDVINIFIRSPTSENPTFPDVGDRILKVDDIFRIFVPKAGVRNRMEFVANILICHQLSATKNFNFKTKFYIFENSHQKFQKGKPQFSIKAQLKRYFLRHHILEKNNIT